MMLTLVQETLASVRPGVELLLPIQYAETGDPALVLSPNWTLYEQLEGNRALVIASVRDDGRMIGYAAAILHRGTSAISELIGTITPWYVEDRKNRAVIAKSLLVYLQNLLFARGAQQVKIQTEYGRSAGRLLEAMGYRPEFVGYRLNASDVKAEHYDA